MESTVKIGDINTWYAREGSGEPLLMLHPGGVGVDSGAFAANIKGMAKHFQVFMPERRGHGRTPDSPGDYSYELMADDTIQFITTVLGGESVRLLGMSDGAVVALMVAEKRPDLVDRLVCVAGVFNNEGWWNAIQPEPLPDFLIESYSSISPDGAGHYEVIHKKLNEMHLNGPKLSAKDLENIKCRTLVMAGDDDEVSLEHTISFYRSLPNAELAIVPGTSHGLMVEKPALCEAIILDFLLNDAIETIAPIRRK